MQTSYAAAIQMARKTLFDTYKLQLVQVLGVGYMIPSDTSIKGSQEAADAYNTLAANATRS